MNQILVTQTGYNDNKGKQKTKKTPSNKASIKSIVRVFSILIIIFGLTLIGESTYAIISSKPKLKDNPIVNTESIGTEAVIKVTTEKPIKQISYKWGQGEETIVQGNGTVELETTVEIPDGNNILNIAVIDYYGNKTEYQKQYINQRNDKQKPTIEIAVSGNNLKITAKDETEIAYLTYKWNDEEVTRVDVESGAEDKKQIQTSIEVRKGQNKLTITAIDKDGNKETRTETIKGANKPTFEIATEGTTLIITARDEEGLSKIAITVDGVTTDTGNTPINQKEIIAKQEITPGSHTITITITNISGLQEEQSFTAVL